MKRSIIEDSQVRWAVRFLAAVLVLISSYTADLPVHAEEPVPSPYAAILEKHNIQADSASLGNYLRSLHPSEQQRLEVERLISELGTAKFAVREAAMTKLMALPNPPTEALRTAERHQDPEIRWRASRVLAIDKTQRAVLMNAVFKTIGRKKISGLVEELLLAIPLCDQRYLLRAATEAIHETAGPDDANLLKQTINSEDAEKVVAAIGGLESAIGKGANEDLQKLLKHENSLVRLKSARSLANQGQRVALMPLVKLLEAKSLEVRLGAAQTLCQVSNTHHRYLAYEDSEKRNEAVARWDAWVNGEGRTAKLHFPLKNLQTELGRTLITIYNKNQVIELDASGKQIWEKTGLKHPWATAGLPNGHRLVSNYGGKSVVEFDAGGKEVWRKDGLPASPFNVQRIENGNTLVACSDSHKVVEILPDGTVAWEITIQGRPMDVQRLENGLTLVTLQNGHRIVEVDRAGKVHWELKGVKSPITAQRLEDGNTLVAEVGGARVAEWDRSGKKVWEHSGLQNPYSAQRLSNGNTLIVHGRDVREVDRQGKITWKKEMTGLAHATRY